MKEKSCLYFQFMEKKYLEGLLLHKNSEIIFVWNPFSEFSLKNHVFHMQFKGIYHHHIATKLNIDQRPLYGEVICTKIKVPEGLQKSETDKRVADGTLYRFYANDSYLIDRFNNGKFCSDRYDLCTKLGNS